MIQRAPEFQVDGKFDLETYRALLAQAGYDPSRFEAAQRLSLRRDQLQRAIRGSAIVTPAQYRRYLNLAAERARGVQLAPSDKQAVANDITISDEMVANYYDNNPTLYRLPETVDFEYVEIARGDVAATVSVSEEDLQDYYAVNPSRYLQDEQRQARHILVLSGDDEATAEVTANEYLLARARADPSRAGA